MKKPPVEFVETAIRIAEGYFSASITAGGFEWITTIFAGYENDGSPLDVDGWMRKRFDEEFVCVGPRPKWLYDAPTWPFMSGQPMVFIGQLSGQEGDHATSDAEYFLFAGLEESGEGARRETKVVAQYHSQCVRP